MGRLMSIQFKDSPSCLKRRACTTCRDLEGGRGFRESVLRTFTVEGGVDFYCPHGLPWGYVEENKQIRTYGKPVCPYLTRTCCGQPNICALGGADVDQSACESCTQRP